MLQALLRTLDRSTHKLRRDEKLSTRAIADQLKVSQSTVSRWLRDYHLL
ncbi:helix-turn-helix domain-containing protein [Glutamicibacter ardleyensis]